MDDDRQSMYKAEFALAEYDLSDWRYLKKRIEDSNPCLQALLDIGYDIDNRQKKLTPAVQRVILTFI
jgi:hypothetical protein